jgi:excisionase family DNA binding protein
MRRTRPPEEIMLVPEVAALMRVTDKTVYRLIETGKLRAYRLGDRVIRIKRADVEALLVQI